jgi:hypothetical protein
MAVQLNDAGFGHAKHLISEGKFVPDESDAWSEHQPSALRTQQPISTG